MSALHSPTGNAALTIFLLVSFATLVTVHIATVFGLARKKLAIDAVASFLIPLVAPWRAFVHGMKARAIFWVISAALYLVAFCLAR